MRTNTINGGMGVICAGSGRSSVPNLASDTLVTAIPVGIGASCQLNVQS